MSDRTLERRVDFIEKDLEHGKKDTEEKERQCLTHIDRTSELEEFMTLHKIEHANIKAEIEGKASKESLSNLKNGWIGHVIQAVLTIGGFLMLYLTLIKKSGG